MRDGAICKERELKRKQKLTKYDKRVQDGWTGLGALCTAGRKLLLGETGDGESYHIRLGDMQLPGHVLDISLLRKAEA